ncbi:30S ribosomal protein S1 [Candidatus Latescibacterota bacterium]
MDDVHNTENTPVATEETDTPEKGGVSEEHAGSILDHLSGKAQRIFNDSDYTEEEFEEMYRLYDNTMKSIEQGNIVQGKVVMVSGDSVIVDIGFKSEGTIPKNEFGEDPAVNEGDLVDVYLDDFENQDGQLVLSKQKADFMKVWDRIKEIYDNDMVLEGRLVRRIKGGIVVDLMGVDAFLPGSQIDIRQVKNFDQYIGEITNLKIIKLNKLRRNIVVSRRAVIEAERAKLREKVLVELEIGQVREGTVKNITDFGAFIDLGGVDGLLHITDMAWGRISHPSEMISIGDTITVKVLNFEEGKTRISLGLKQLTPYPWDGVEEKYPVGSVVEGRVVSTTDYGAFVELEHGIEGLVHISEMSWTQHVKHPSKIVKVGEQIKVKVLNIDKAGEKISLGIKQLEPDPWSTIDERHPVGNTVTGKVRNLTNFGAFVEIEEGIDGLVHISDMSWTKRIKHPSEVVKKGEMIQIMILDIDKDNRRISLGHKQIFEDPWATLEEKFSVGQITMGTIIRILDRGVVVELDNNIEGFVPTFQLGPDVKKPADAFETGEELPLKVIEFDKDQRKIILSVREYFKDRDKAELEEFKEKHKPKPVTLGDAFSDILEGSVEGAAETETSSPAEEPGKPADKTQPAEEDSKTAEEPVLEPSPGEEPVSETGITEEAVQEAEPEEEPVAEAEAIEEPAQEAASEEEPVAEEAMEEPVPEPAPVEEPVAEAETAEEEIQEAEPVEKPPKKIKPAKKVSKKVPAEEPQTEPEDAVQPSGESEEGEKTPDEKSASGERDSSADVSEDNEQ